MRYTILASAFALTLATPAASESPPLPVLATVGMIADVAENVAGDCVAVETLIGPGVDPHDYSATPSDVRRLEAAELVFYVHPALEEQLARVLERFGARVPTVGVLEAALDAGALLDDPDAPGTVDPHIWMDVARWARIAPVIAEAVADQRPDCAEAMEPRLAAYTAQLDALHGWVAEAIATIPEGQRLLVTAHDAFEYYADAYGMEASEAIEGISSASEAAIADIREVADFVVDRGVGAVFVETTISPRTIEALVAEVRARGHDVVIGGELFSDAMGDPGTPGGTYIGMIAANTATITHALGGALPPLPEALAGLPELAGHTD